MFVRLQPQPINSQLSAAPIPTTILILEIIDCSGPKIYQKNCTPCVALSQTNLILNKVVEFFSEKKHIHPHHHSWFLMVFRPLFRSMPRTFQVTGRYISLLLVNLFEILHRVPSLRNRSLRRPTRQSAQSSPGVLPEIMDTME